MWFNLKNPWSSSRHMLSKLVGDPRAKSSGKLDTITFASAGFDPVTGVMLLQDSSSSSSSVPPSSTLTSHTEQATRSSVLPSTDLS